MLYLTRFLAGFFVFCSCFAFAPLSAVGRVFLIILNILIIYLVSRYTRFVVTKFNKVAKEVFKNNYIESNLYVARNYVTAMYFDEINKKICFLSSGKYLVGFDYDDLQGVEFVESRKTLVLNLVSEGKRQNISFFYQRNDLGHLNSIIEMILG